MEVSVNGGSVEVMDRTPSEDAILQKRSGAASTRSWVQFPHSIAEESVWPSGCLLQLLKSSQVTVVLGRQSCDLAMQLSLARRAALVLYLFASPLPASNQTTQNFLSSFLDSNIIFLVFLDSEDEKRGLAVLARSHVHGLPTELRAGYHPLKDQFPNEAGTGAHLNSAAESGQRSCLAGVGGSGLAALLLSLLHLSRSTQFCPGPSERRKLMRGLFNFCPRRPGIPWPDYVLL